MTIDQFNDDTFTTAPVLIPVHRAKQRLVNAAAHLPADQAVEVAKAAWLDANLDAFVDNGLVNEDLIALVEQDLLAESRVRAAQTAPRPASQQAVERGGKTTDTRAKFRYTDMEQMVAPTKERYDLYAKYPNAGAEPTGVYPAFDKFVKLRPGTVCVIGGRPGVGKSSFALEASAHISARGHVVAVMTEGSLELYIDRLVSALGHIDGWKLQDPTSETRAAADKTLEWLAREAKLHILESNSASLDEIVEMVKQLKASRFPNEPMRLLLLDNMTSMAGASGAQNNRGGLSFGITGMMDRLVNLSKPMGFDCPIMLVVHAKREAAATALAKDKASGATGRVGVEHLGESDGLGRLADSVIILTKDTLEDLGAPRVPASKDPENPFSGPAETDPWVVNSKKDLLHPDAVKVTANIVKNRSGKEGRLEGQFIGPQFRFVFGDEQLSPLTMGNSGDTTLDDEYNELMRERPDAFGYDSL